ncbi:MAG: DUF2461 family protein [Bdellovibrionia bacterium]
MTKMSIQFSRKTLDFLVKAAKQKNPEWLDLHHEEYEAVLKKPFIALAEQIKKELQPQARDYHFPSKGLARIKRPEFKVRGGQPQYKDWISMIAAKPSPSRFESNPHLFFGLFPNENDKVIIAGGLWQPTPRQARLIREAIANDSTDFHKLFKDKKFKASFPDGFYPKEKSLRVPRGFSEEAEDIEWIKLKKYVVYKSVPIKAFIAPHFQQSVVKDLEQALRLNRLLEKALDVRERFNGATDRQ